MTSINICLPILQCTSCNKYYSHMLSDYYRFLKELNKMIETNFNFELDYEMITTHENEKRNIYKLFIQPFYLYGSDEDKKLLNINSVVVYGLLTRKQMNKKDFPFCKNIATNYRYCCSRMFLCDNSLGFN